MGVAPVCGLEHPGHTRRLPPRSGLALRLRRSWSPSVGIRSSLLTRGARRRRPYDAPSVWSWAEGAAKQPHGVPPKHLWFHRCCAPPDGQYQGGGLPGKTIMSGAAAVRWSSERALSLALVWGQARVFFGLCPSLLRPPSRTAWMPRCFCFTDLYVVLLECCPRGIPV